MRFMIIADDFYPDAIPFLKGQLKATSDPSGEVLYDVDESLREKLKVFEEAGYIKEIKSSVEELESADDIIRSTESVKLVQGGVLYLKVKLFGHELTFQEDELLSPRSLKKKLLRLKSVIGIKQTDWLEILRYWLKIGQEVSETSEEDVICEKVLNYLNNCVIYSDKDKADAPFSLYYDKNKPEVVYCVIDEIVERLEFDDRRRLRSILEEYIAEGKQFRVRGGMRKRFWAFEAKKCEIDFEKQLEKTETEENEGEENEQQQDWFETE